MGTIILVVFAIGFVWFAVDIGMPANKQEGSHVPLLFGIVVLLFLVFYPGFVNLVGNALMNLLGGR